MNDLLNFVKVRNESFVSVQVCDEEGGFVFYDRNTENILEKGRDSLKKSSLIELMVPLSTAFLAF